MGMVSLIALVLLRKESFVASASPGEVLGAGRADLALAPAPLMLVSATRPVEKRRHDPRFATMRAYKN